MDAYELLLACYRSGQISERQWQLHMSNDPVFAEYVREKVT